MNLPTTRVILVRHGRSTFNDQGRYQGSSNSSVLTEKGLQTAHQVGTYLNQRFYKKASNPKVSEPPIDLIYTSPLRRVQQTAEAISQAIAPSARPPVVVNSYLKEISLSLWEGLTYNYVKQQYSEEYQTWQQRPELFELPVSFTQTQRLKAQQSVADGKPVTLDRAATAIAQKTYFPVRDLYQAAQQFWQTVLPQHPGHTLLIVSHSGTIHALISTALGLSPRHHHSLQQSNCGISELTFCRESNGNNSLSADSSSFSDLSSRYSVQLHQLNQTAALGETLPKIKTNKKGLRLLLLPNDKLTLEACKRLTCQIASLPLDFCLAANMGASELSALLRDCLSVMRLEADSANFLQAWQQQLVNSPRPAQSLLTALAIAPAASIRQLLWQTLGHQSPIFDATLPGRDCIQLHPHLLSVVHYPHQHRPVVQAINTLCEPDLAATALDAQSPHA